MSTPVAAMRALAWSGAPVSVELRSYPGCHVSPGRYSRRSVLKAAAVGAIGAATAEFARRHSVDSGGWARRDVAAPAVPQNAVLDGVREVDYIGHADPQV